MKTLLGIIIGIAITLTVLLIIGHSGVARYALIQGILFAFLFTTACVVVTAIALGIQAILRML